MSANTLPETPSFQEFDKNFFYCVREDGSEAVVVAKDEDEIGPAKLVLSLEEVNSIRDRLMHAQKAVATSVIQPAIDENDARG